MFVDGAGPVAPGLLGDVVAMMLGLPEGICLNEIVIRPTGGLKALNVTINGTDGFHLTAEQLAQPVVSIDISPYLVAGVNTVQYNPVGRNGGATVNVNVE